MKTTPIKIRNGTTRRSSHAKRGATALMLALVATSFCACPYRVESGSAFGFDIPDSAFFPNDVIVDPFEPAESLAGFLDIQGDLVITDVEASLLTNFEIVSIGGDLIIENNPGLASLSFRALESVGGEIRVINNPSLQNITLDALIDARSLEFDSAPTLTFIAMDSLSVLSGALGGAGGGLRGGSGGDLRIDCPRLTTIAFPALAMVAGDVLLGGISFAGNAAATTIELNRLVEVDGDFLILRNSSLRSLSAQRLAVVQGVFAIEHNPQLVELDFSALTTAQQGLCICSNDALDGCLASSIVDGVTSISGPTTVEDNLNICMD